MRVALISDIHANLPALESVLDHIAQSGGTDAIYCLGDIVGYGPHPNEVVGRLAAVDSVCVLGNHDAAAIGAITTEAFNPAAAAASEWTATQLTPAAKAFLGILPKVVRRDPLTLVHGSLRDPLWEYLVTHDAALAQLGGQQTSFSAVGHTHVPLVVWEADGVIQVREPEAGEPIVLQAPACVNPGSVGQPRDGDPRAAYAVFEADTDRVELTLHRVEYEIAATAAAMREAGLPRPLAERLTTGR